MPLAENKSVAGVRTGGVWIDPQRSKVKSCKDIYTGETRSQMRGARLVRSFDNAGAERPGPILDFKNCVHGIKLCVCNRMVAP